MARLRRRAVQITPEALTLLKEALERRWRECPEAKKLTREERARILGVSVGTCERILRGDGVDRPTLTIAFKSVGLPWQDSYCQFVDEASATQDAPSVRQDPSAGRRFRPLELALGASLSFALLLAVGFLLQRDSDWRLEAVPLLNAADKAFQDGRYAEARIKLERTIEITRANNAAAHLASALRLAGDLASAEGRFEEAKNRYTEAKGIWSSLNMRVCLPAMDEAIGVAEKKLGEYGSAEKSFNSALAGFTELNDANGMAMAYRGLGTVAFEVFDFEGANAFFEKALKAVNDSPGLKMDILARRALVYRETNRLPEARAILRECLTFWKAEQHPRWIATTEFQLATVDLLSGDETNAVSLLTSSRSKYAELGDSYGEHNCNSWLSRVNSKL